MDTWAFTLQHLDFDGNGAPDLATSNLDGTVTVLLNDGAGRFSEPSHLDGRKGTLRGIVAADFNGDGLADIAAAAPLSARLAVFLNLGNGRFAEASSTLLMSSRPR